jgi:hypothetical protein
LYFNFLSASFLTTFVFINIIIIIIIMSLVTGLFFLAILLNQQRPPPLKLQVSDCSNFRIMSDVPSVAAICSVPTECFPGMT